MSGHHEYFLKVNLLYYMRGHITKKKKIYFLNANLSPKIKRRTPIQT